jgi:hypothetical protein
VRYIKMAKRRRRKTRTIYARPVSYRRAPKRRSSRKRGGMLARGIGTALSAGLYGALRARVSNALVPFTQQLPLGTLGDEAGMLVALWGLKKIGRGNSLINDVAKAGTAIEWARIGEAVVNGQVNFGFGNATTSKNMSTMVV